MQAPQDPHELAAVVADGRPFDWSAVEGGRDVRTMSALWRAMRAHAAGETTGHTRVPVSPAAALLTALAVGKALVALVVGVAGFAHVNPMQFATLLSFTLVGALLVWGGGRDIRARHLGLLLLTLCQGLANPLLAQGSSGWESHPAWLPWIRAVTVEAFWPATAWLFARDFPAAALSPRMSRRLQRGFQWSMLAGALLFIANLLLGAGFAVPGLWIFDRDSNGTSYFWLIVFFLIAPALVLMVRRRKEAPPAERAKVTVFMSALGLTLLPALLVMALANRASPLRPWLLAHFTLVGVFMYTGLVVLPLTTAYAVLAHRVVRIEPLLLGVVRSVLGRAILTIAVVGPLSALVGYAWWHRSMPLVDVFAAGTGRTLLIMGAVAAALLAVRPRLLLVVEGALHRARVPLDSALEDFARRSRQGLGLGDVAEALHRTVTESFHPEVVSLLVADRARQMFVPLGAPLGHLAQSTWLVQALTQTHDPVVVDLEDANGVARLLPRAEQEWLADSSVLVLVPLLASGGEPCAVLALGRRSGGDSYDDNDLRFLAALAGAAGPTVEARLLRTAASPIRGLDEVNWDDESGRECHGCGRVFAADVPACAHCRQPTVTMAVPVLLHGKFAVVRRLGAGAMGVVYLARDESLDRPVALKTLPRVMPEAVQRLRREARTMASVSHPAIATIHGLESWRAVPVLVVEYLPGGTLADRLREGPMAEAEVIAMARQLLGGLRHLHRAGLLHRDLKPSNIGFTEDGSAKLLDFGLSRLVGGGPAGPSLFGSDDHGVLPDGTAVSLGASGLAGTPLYMSPEVVNGAAPDAGLDLWALAVVMTEALAGRHPWALLGADEVLRRICETGAPPLPGEWSCSPALAALLARTLDRNINVRPQTAEEFDQELNGLHNDLGPIRQGGGE